MWWQALLSSSRGIRALHNIMAYLFNTNGNDQFSESHTLLAFIQKFLSIAPDTIGCSLVLFSHPHPNPSPWRQKCFISQNKKIGPDELFTNTGCKHAIIRKSYFITKETDLQAESDVQYSCHLMGIYYMLASSTTINAMSQNYYHDASWCHKYSHFPLRSIECHSARKLFVFTSQI